MEVQTTVGYQGDQAWPRPAGRVKGPSRGYRCANWNAGKGTNFEGTREGRWYWNL